MIALVVVSRRLLERIGASKIELQGGRIEFLLLQHRTARNPKIFAKR
jgi:hypothetical protein